MHRSAWVFGCILWGIRRLRLMCKPLCGQAAHALRYIMVPKVETVDDVMPAVAAVDAARAANVQARPLPMHVLD